ncbi:MAG: MerR family transcriptional regulator [Deltaproteobacteria bacterium]|nr:MerR family transcriptional regulator [Candidatus Tharpellaceae bacterium]
MTGLTIGKLSNAAGVSTDIVRFYERCGLPLTYQLRRNTNERCQS